MPALDAPANVRRFSFEASALPPDTFRVVSFQGEEALSELFSFTLHLSSKDPDLDFDEIVGRPATFTMDRAGEDVPTYGLVTELRQHGRSADYVSYEAVLRPRCWRGTLQENSRVFQQQSVPDIIEEILKDRLGLAASQDFDLSLSGSYPQREYCVQHEETDWAFLNRLTRREGLYFFFDHSSGRDRLVVCDDRQAHQKIGDPAALVYGTGEGMNRPVPESVQGFSMRQRLVEAAAELHSYNYETPTTDLRTKEKAEGGGVSGGGAEPLAQNVTDAFADVGEGRRLAKVRAEAIACRRRQIEGRSDCAGLRAGRVFTLKEHYRRDLSDADYLLARVRHAGTQRSALPPGAGIEPRSLYAPENGASGGASGGAASGNGASGDGVADDGQPEAPSYHNTFDCLPQAVPYRPAYDPSDKPRLPGLMTATIEGSGESEDYPFLDEEGRYRARLHFDQRSGRAQGTATLPIRLAQPSSGREAGTHLPNPAGTELVVGHVDGDPDRPLALGTAPNPSQRSPVTAKNRSQSIIRTPGGNELVLEDRKEKAFARLRTPGGHVFTLTDADEKAEILTTTGHRATLDDEKKRIEVQTRDGHQLRLDDEKNRIQVQTKGKHRLLLDEESELLEISDAAGKNSVRIDFGANQITVESAEGGIGLKAPEGEVLVESKTFRLETEGEAVLEAGGKLEASAGQSMTLEAGTSFEATSGTALTATGGTTAKFEGSTNTTLKGTMTKVVGQIVDVG